MLDVKINISVDSFFLLKDFPSVVVVGLGKSGTGVCGKENWDNCKESIRAAVSGKYHCCVRLNFTRPCQEHNARVRFHPRIKRN